MLLFVCFQFNSSWIKGSSDHLLLYRFPNNIMSTRWRVMLMANLCVFFMSFCLCSVCSVPRASWNKAFLGGLNCYYYLFVSIPLSLSLFHSFAFCCCFSCSFFFFHLFMLSFLCLFLFLFFFLSFFWCFFLFVCLVGYCAWTFVQ